MEYKITYLYIEGGALTFRVNKAIPAKLKADLTLHIGPRANRLQAYRLADATLANHGSTLIWPNTRLSKWSNGATSELRLTRPATTRETPTTPTEEPPQTFPALDRLPVDETHQTRPATQRGPYCFIGEGNGTTEYVRYPDGSIREIAKQSAAIRRLFSCK